jgi:hypothetical protein
VFGESRLDALKVGVELGKLFFVGGKELFLKPFQLQMFQEMDFVLMFVVPVPEGGLGDVQFFGDFGEAPAIGPEGHEGAELGWFMHKISSLLVSVFRDPVRFWLSIMLLNPA